MIGDDTEEHAPHHEWGSNFDFKSLDKACRFFQKYLWILARVKCYTKEKYGTMRLEYFYYCDLKLYKRFIFNLITLVAVKRWPHIQEEITDEYEFRDLLYKWVKKYINYKCYWRDCT